MDDRNAAAPPEPARASLLLFAMLAPAAFWAARLGGAYALVPFACRHGWGAAALHGVSAAALLGCIAAGAVGWRSWRRAGAVAGVELGGPVTRTRFMGLFGMGMASFFGLVIVAEQIGSWMIDPCLTGGVPADWFERGSG